MEELKRETRKWLNEDFSFDDKDEKAQIVEEVITFMCASGLSLFISYLEVTKGL